MRILVCVKQVPDSGDVRINPETNTLMRGETRSIVNPNDSYALELALELKDICSASVDILSMGPVKAKTALSECLAMGADDAWLLCDPAFGGADTLATSYTLAEAIRFLQKQRGAYDLILCGKQTLDSNTAQVGPEVAEFLGLPQLTGISDARMTAGGLVAEKQESGGTAAFLCSFPCLLTVHALPRIPRLPGLKRRLEVRKKEIPVLDSSDFPIDTQRTGGTGSPTRVRKTYVPPACGKTVKIEDDGSEKIASTLMEFVTRYRTA